MSERANSSGQGSRITWARTHQGLASKLAAFLTKHLDDRYGFIVAGCMFVFMGLFFPVWLWLSGDVPLQAVLFAASFPLLCGGALALLGLDDSPEDERSRPLLKLAYRSMGLVFMLGLILILAASTVRL